MGYKSPLGKFAHIDPVAEDAPGWRGPLERHPSLAFMDDSPDPADSRGLADGDADEEKAPDAKLPSARYRPAEPTYRPAVPPTSQPANLYMPATLHPIP